MKTLTLSWRRRTGHGRKRRNDRCRWTIGQERRRARDRICCPTMVLRGEKSDLITPDTTRQMAERGPKARVVEIAGVGHAPTLIHEDQIRLVRTFLDSTT